MFFQVTAVNTVFFFYYEGLVAVEIGGRRMCSFQAKFVGDG